MGSIIDILCSAFMSSMLMCGIVFVIFSTYVAIKVLFIDTDWKEVHREILEEWDDIKNGYYNE